MARTGRSANIDVVVVGARAHPLRDAYHFILRMPWAPLLAGIALLVMVLNLIFAIAFYVSGGVTGAAPGSFRDAFFFSVQTMGTIGYGALYPSTTAANTIMTIESVVGLLMTALVTGIVFARFSQSTGQLVFSDTATIGPMDGIPTLSFRVGNDRGNTVFDARIRAGIIRTEKTIEGMTFYRQYDLKLTRDTSMALQRSWTVMHKIEKDSPLYGATPETFVSEELEIVATVVGTDDTSLQPVYGRVRYVPSEIIWGARHADVLSELDDGRIQLDIRRFDELVVTEPTADFPFPRPKT